ncbi:MAG: hypothetical protein HRU36_03610 [Rickettsiales bacterium]|nr:hypothetical protein [Rickettsiales bacterium]
MSHQKNLCTEFFISNHHSELNKNFDDYIIQCGSYIDAEGRNILLKAIELEAPANYIEQILHNTNVNIYATDNASHNIWNYFNNQSTVTNDSMCAQKILLNYLQDKAIECYKNHSYSMLPTSITCSKEMSLFGLYDTHRITTSDLCKEITITMNSFEQYTMGDNAIFENKIKSLFEDYNDKL